MDVFWVWTVSLSCHVAISYSRMLIPIHAVQVFPRHRVPWVTRSAIWSCTCRWYWQQIPLLENPSRLDTVRKYEAATDDLDSLFPYRWPSQPLPKPSVLRVGYCLDDGVCRPTAPVIRGVQAALTALRQCEGFELVEFTPREPEESWDVAVST